MSVAEYEKQIEKLMDKRDKLEEKCDTLPECQEDDGCETCEIYKKIEKLDEEIEGIEDKLEKLLAAEEE